MYLWLVRVKAYKTVWQSFYSDQSQTPHFRDRHAQPLTLKSGLCIHKITTKFFPINKLINFNAIPFKEKI